MFLPNSRYSKLATVQTTTSTGESVTALKLRPLTSVTGTPQQVEANDRLDLIAQHVTGDATQFWHIADANTALDGRTLTAEPGATLLVPKA
mgnify:CR=1 FL=1